MKTSMAQSYETSPTI